MASQSYRTNGFPPRPPRAYTDGRPGPSRRPSTPGPRPEQYDEIHEMRDFALPRTYRPGPHQMFDPSVGVGAPSHLSPPPSYSTVNSPTRKSRFHTDDYKLDKRSLSEDDLEAALPPRPIPVRSACCGLNPRRVGIAVAIAVATGIAIVVGYTQTHKHKSSSQLVTPANGTASATPTISATPTNTAAASSTSSVATATPTPGMLADGTYQVFGSLASAPCFNGATGLTCASSVSENWAFTSSGNTYTIAPDGLRNVSATANKGALSFQYGEGSYRGNGCVVTNVDTAAFTLLGNKFNGTLQSTNTITTACEAGPVNAYCECIYDVTGV